MSLADIARADTTIDPDSIQQRLHSIVIAAISTVCSMYIVYHRHSTCDV